MQNEEFLKYEKLIHYFANKYAFSFKEEIDDLFQVGAIGLLKAKSSYQFGKGKFSNWASLKIKEEILKYLRHKYKLRCKKHKIEFVHYNVFPEFSKMYSTESKIDLSLALENSGLSPQEKSIIILFYFKDLEETAIAKILKKKVKTVHSSKTRALFKLKQYYQIPVPLTNQEENIIKLVQLGLKNKEIANQLNISCRTVERHLFVVFKKKGITNRQLLINKFMIE